MMPVSSLSPATNARATVEQQRLEQVAQAFEAIFLRDMIGAMRKAGLNEDLLGNSGGSQFRDMMDERVADDMAQTKGIGIAQLLVAQWKDRI